MTDELETTSFILPKEDIEFIRRLAAMHAISFAAAGRIIVRTYIREHGETINGHRTRNSDIDSVPGDVGLDGNI